MPGQLLSDDLPRWRRIQMSLARRSITSKLKSCAVLSGGKQLHDSVRRALQPIGAHGALIAGLHLFDQLLTKMGTTCGRVLRSNKMRLRLSVGRREDFQLSLENCDEPN